jgi:hypothetical protein
MGFCICCPPHSRVVLGRPAEPADQGVLDDGGATGAGLAVSDGGGESAVVPDDGGATGAELGAPEVGGVPVGVVDGGGVDGGVVGVGDVVVVAGGGACVGAVVGAAVGVRVGPWLASTVSCAEPTCFGRDREASV